MPSARLATLAVATLLSLTACEEIDPTITAREGEMIYNQMVLNVSRELTAKPAGAFNETIQCPAGGSWSIDGEVLDTGSDRGWDVQTTASGCGIGAIFADGEEIYLTLDGGPVDVFSPPAGDDTPFASSGTVSWSNGNRSGTCTLFDSPAEGTPGGCD